MISVTRSGLSVPCLKEPKFLTGALTTSEWTGLRFGKSALAGELPQAHALVGPGVGVVLVDFESLVKTAYGFIEAAEAVQRQAHAVPGLLVPVIDSQRPVKADDRLVEAAEAVEADAALVPGPGHPVVDHQRLVEAGKSAVESP